MQKITIGLFNDSFPPMIDGVGSVVDNYAKRLSKLCNVVVFVPKYKEYFDDSKLPYKVVRCKSRKVPFIDYSLPLPLFDKKFRSEVKKYNLDLIHIHSPFTIGKYGVRFAKKNNIPVIGTIHSQLKQDFRRAVKIEEMTEILTHKMIKVYNDCDKCFAVNSGMAKLYFEEYGLKKLPEVLGNATEYEYVKDKSKDYSKINKLHNLKDSDKVFLFVGRINKLKNVFFIIDSLFILNKRKLNYNYKMIFVGDGQDRLELEKYVKKKKLSDKVIFAGEVKDRNLLRSYYIRSDLFLFPSLYDASSIVQIEAASQKVPTIFLEGSKTSSDITDKVNGFIAKDEENFANIIDLLMNDKKLYDKISKNVYRDVYKNWDNVVEDIYKMYLEIIRGD